MDGSPFLASGRFYPGLHDRIRAVAKLKSEFAQRNVKVLAVSVDPLESHHSWVQGHQRTQSCNMNFPIIADPERKSPPLTT